MLLEYIGSALLGYLIGNFSPSYILGKRLKNIDIREHGSGNAGATNVNRVLGLRAGLLAFCLDALKGVLAVLIGRWLGQEIGSYIAGVAVILGHNWPVFLGFRGGKGVAASVGVLAVLFPLQFVIVLAIGLSAVFITHYVSLGSMIMGVLTPIVLALFGKPLEAIIFGIILGLLILWRHKSNISRLLAGTESKLHFKSQPKA